MDEQIPERLEAPRKSAAVWADAKHTARWLFAAACARERVSTGEDWSGAEVTEADFDAAIDRAR